MDMEVMDDLSRTLWRERELLESLAFKLEVQRLVLGSGRTRWLANVTREIEQVLEDLRATEVLRATVADGAAQSVGLDPNPSLTSLAEASDEPWRAILIDHRDTMLGLAREIAETSEEAKELINIGYRSTRETLLSVGQAGTESYRPNGTAVVDAQRSVLLDRSL